MLHRGRHHLYRATSSSFEALTCVTGARSRRRRPQLQVPAVAGPRNQPSPDREPLKSGFFCWCCRMSSHHGISLPYILEITLVPNWEQIGTSLTENSPFHSIRCLAFCLRKTHHRVVRKQLLNPLATDDQYWQLRSLIPNPLHKFFTAFTRITEVCSYSAILSRFCSKHLITD